MRKRRLVSTILGAASLLCASSGAQALSLYGNNATPGSAYIYVIDPATGAVTDQFTVSGGGTTNGRGVAVVGNTLYYTTSISNAVYDYDLSTHTDLGAAFTVAGATALSTLAYDGTDFWVGDYSGTNHAYLYTPTGTLLDTISLSKCKNNCDGLEFFLQGGTTPRLVSNEGDAVGPYDLYDTNGNLVQAGFIDPSKAGITNATTGIAFDGTNFYVSEIHNGKIAVFDANGNFVREETVTGGTVGGGPVIEDLSVDYTKVLPPVPKPSTTLLLALGLVGISARRTR